MTDWMTIGNLAGKAINLFKGSSANSARVTEALNRRLMKYQYDLERESKRHSFQDTRDSLEEANYNPLLAVGQQAQGVSVGSGVSALDPATEQVQNASSAITAAAAEKQADTQAKLATSQAELNNTTSWSIRGKTPYEIEKIAQDTQTSKAQESNLNANSAVQQATQKQIQAQTEYQNMVNGVYAQTGLIQALSNIGLTKAQISQSYSSAMANQAQANLANMNSKEIAQRYGINEERAKWYKNHPKAAQTQQWINNVIAPGVSSFRGLLGGFSANSTVYNIGGSIQ